MVSLERHTPESARPMRRCAPLPNPQTLKHISSAPHQPSLLSTGQHPPCCSPAARARRALSPSRGKGKAPRTTPDRTPQPPPRPQQGGRARRTRTLLPKTHTRPALPAASPTTHTHTNCDTDTARRCTLRADPAESARAPPDRLPPYRSLLATELASGGPAQPPCENPHANSPTDERETPRA